MKIVVNKLSAKYNRSIMAKTCGIAALIVLALSVVAHLATFVPAIPITMQLVWPLHLATLAMAAAMVFSQMTHYRGLPKPPAKGFFADLFAAQKRDKAVTSKMISLVPSPLRAMCMVAVYYAVLNFVLFFLNMQSGSPSIENGKYFLMSHGTVIREITKEEYRRFQAYEVRGFSGHWIAFSIIPMTYFLVVSPKLEKGLVQRVAYELNIEHESSDLATEEIPTPYRTKEIPTKYGIMILLAILIGVFIVISQL
jgi:hypothetical protein